MTSTRTKRAKSNFSYSAGGWGENRVRVYTRSGSPMIQIEVDGGSGKQRRSLGFSDTERAKKLADRLAAELRDRPSTLLTETPTLRVLFDNYLKYRTPDKKDQKRQHDRATLGMLQDFFGPNTKAEHLSHKQWHAFIEARASGKIRPKGANPRRTKGVSNRTVQYDLMLLKAVYKWGENWTAEGNTPLLSKNPIATFKAPTPKDTKRPMLTSAEYHAMLEVADQVGPMVGTMLILANETGHRINAILNLKWSEINFVDRVITWRAETDKMGRTHLTPITETALKALEEHREKSDQGEWVFPSPKNPAKQMRRDYTGKIWTRLEKLAGIQRVEGRGFHSLRRKFANDLIDQPLAVVAALGGWKNPRVMVELYQNPNSDQMREALSNRKAS